jgi:hypothetical protein
MTTGDYMIYPILRYERGYFSRYSDSLRAGQARDQILVGARFSAPVQTGHGAHTVPYTTGIGSFPGVKRPRRGVDHQTSSSP